MTDRFLCLWEADMLCVLRLGHVRGSVDSSLAAPSSALGEATIFQRSFAVFLGPRKMFFDFLAFGDPRVTVRISTWCHWVSNDSKSLAVEWPLQIWSPLLAAGEECLKLLVLAFLPVCSCSKSLDVWTVATIVSGWNLCFVDVGCRLVVHRKKHEKPPLGEKTHKITLQKKRLWCRSEEKKWDCFFIIIVALWFRKEWSCLNSLGQVFDLYMVHFGVRHLKGLPGPYGTGGVSNLIFLGKISLRKTLTSIYVNITSSKHFMSQKLQKKWHPTSVQLSCVALMTSKTMRVDGKMMHPANSIFRYLQMNVFSFNETEQMLTSRFSEMGSAPPPAR